MRLWSCVSNHDLNAIFVVQIVSLRENWEYRWYCGHCFPHVASTDAGIRIATLDWSQSALAGRATPCERPQQWEMQFFGSGFGRGWARAQCIPRAPVRVVYSQIAGSTVRGHDR